MKKIVNINESNLAQVIKPLVEKYLKEGVRRKRLTEHRIDRIISENIHRAINETWEDTYRSWKNALNNGASFNDPNVIELGDQWPRELKAEYPDFDKRGHAFDMASKRIDFENGKLGDDDTQYERHNILKRQRELDADEDPMDDLDVLSLRDKEWNGADDDEDDDIDDSDFYNDDLAKDFGI
jgi:hypothetical protein